MMALARGAASREQSARLGELFGNPDLDEDGAAELRQIIVETKALEKIEQMIRVRADAAMAALAEAPLPEETRKELTVLASAAVERRL
jgi:geranylgeranyl diphosphate synthase type I